MIKNSLKNIRKKILYDSKKYIKENGWNDELLDKLSKENKYKLEEIMTLFPDGYKSLLKFYLDDLNLKMINSAKKINFKNINTSSRIKKLILLRLKLYQSEKKIIKKTYLTLLKPNNFKVTSKNLYNIVDEIWYIAGDNSTDFNFYSKRIILTFVYIPTVLYWIKNDNNLKVEKFLDAQLKSVSKIPKIKKHVNNIPSILFDKIQLTKNFINSKL